MILCAVRIYPRPGIAPAVLEALESLRGPIANSVGCLGCSIAVETGEGGAICYQERWHTGEALDRHLRSALYGRILEVIECSSLPPEIEFYEVAAVGGLERVERARIHN